MAVRDTLLASVLQCQGCVRTPQYFSVHTQNGQLADGEEIFAERDKKVYLTRITAAPDNMINKMHFLSSNTS